MSAGAVTPYSNAVLDLSKGGIDLATTPIALALINGGYTPEEATDLNWAACSGYELASASGYTQGGVQLSGQASALSSNTVTFSASGVAWANFSAAFAYGVLVVGTAGSLTSGDPLLAFFPAVSGGGSVTGGGGTLSVNWNNTSPTGSIFTFTHTP